MMLMGHAKYLTEDFRFIVNILGLLPDSRRRPYLYYQSGPSLSCWFDNRA